MTGDPPGHRALGPLKCVTESGCQGQQPMDFHHKLFVFFIPHVLPLGCSLHFQHGMLRVLIYPSTHEHIFIMKAMRQMVFEHSKGLSRTSGQKANKCLNTGGAPYSDFTHSTPSCAHIPTRESDSPSLSSFIPPP